METRAYLGLSVLVVSVLLTSVEADTCSESPEYSYDIEAHNGPAYWSVSFPQHCAGMKQSPINIETSNVEEDKVTRFTLVGFGEDVPDEASMTVLNNGHTICVSVGGDYLVSEGGLEGVYELKQFHFHWGSTDAVGSEHTVDGKQYPAEIHFVTLNTKYAVMGTALNSTDGLAVLGFFIEVQAQDNPAFASLINAISMLQYDGDEEELAEPIVLDSLFPNNMKTFYRYPGSLTTPNCSEVVTWTIFTAPIFLSEAQLMVFRNQYENKASASQNVTLTNTFRPVQPINNRTVYLMTESDVHHDTGVDSSAPGLCATTSLIAIVVIQILALALTE